MLCLVYPVFSVRILYRPFLSLLWYRHLLLIIFSTYICSHMFLEGAYDNHPCFRLLYVYLQTIFYVFDHRMILLLFCVFSTERQGHLEADIYLWLFATTKVQLYKVLYVNTSVVWFRRPGKFWNMIDHIFAIVFSFPQLLHWGVTLRGMAKKLLLFADNIHKDECFQI